MESLVKVENLDIDAVDVSGSRRRIVKDVSFDIGKGEVLALIGESGSGKTTIAMALMGYFRTGTKIAGGRVTLSGRTGDADSVSSLEKMRGKEVCYIAQSAAAAFNPGRTIMAQVIESAIIHKVMTKAQAESKAVGLFRELSLPDPETIGSRYPHQVSGGQLQRLLAAMAMLTSPKLIIFDEPTTALDVTTQIDVLLAFKKLVREHDVTALYVTHDLAVVAQIADRIVVLRNGEVQETGATKSLVEEPQHPYTRSLMAAASPQARVPSAASAREPLLRVAGLTAGYGPPHRGGTMPFPVLQDVSFDIPQGATLGVVGESGCGKSTLARVIAGLLPLSSGTMSLDGKLIAPTISGRSRDQLRRIQIVYQTADTALNPVHTIGEIMERPLVFYHGMSGEARRKRLGALLDMVRLPRDVIGRRHGALSGGQKQRVNLARALAAEPSLILCDEVTSALDSVVGAAILDLLVELQKEFGLSYMFISHDLSTVRSLCDEVLVLYAGQMSEIGSRAAFNMAPWHPYSELLIKSVPELRTGWLDEVTANRPRMAGGATMAPRGQLCSFHTRCPVVVEGVCETELPPVRSLSKGARVRCQRTQAALEALALNKSAVI